MCYRHMRRDPSSNRRNLIFHKHVAALVGCVILAVTPGTASPQSPAQGDKEFSTLPFTADQAVHGGADYQRYCSACHGAHLEGGDSGGPPLLGAYFKDHWGTDNLPGLFTYTKSLMPTDNPGSLTDATYAAILAYILQYNGYKLPAVSMSPTFHSN